MWIIIGIAALLIIVWLFTGSQTINNTSTPSYIGMYNMNLHIEYKKSTLRHETHTIYMLQFLTKC